MSIFESNKKQIAGNMPDTAAGDIAALRAAQGSSQYLTRRAILGNGDADGQIVAPSIGGEDFVITDVLVSASAACSVSLYASDLAEYKALVLSSAPLHYWPLDEGSGDALDEGSGGIDLTEAGSPTRESIRGVSSDFAAMAFDGAADYFIATSVSPPTSSTGAIELWYYASERGSQNLFCISDGTNADYLKINVASNEGWLRLRGQVNGENNFSTGGHLVLNTWNHIVMQSTGAETEMWLNGVSVAVNYSVGGHAWLDDLTGLDRIVVGALDNGSISQYVEGGLCHVAYYNAALSESVIQSHYFAGAAFFGPHYINGYSGVSRNVRRPKNVGALGVYAYTDAADAVTIDVEGYFE